MKDKEKLIVLAICVALFVGLVFGNVLSPYINGYFIAFSELVGFRPTHSDQLGHYYSNHALTNTDGLVVAVYNGKAKSRFGVGCGSDDFNKFARNDCFDFRICADNVDDVICNLQEILRLNPSLGGIKTICIIDHGNPAFPRIGGHAVPPKFFNFLAKSAKSNIMPTLILFGCEIAKGYGSEYCQNLADDIGYRVVAPNRTIFPAWDSISDIQTFPCFLPQTQKMLSKIE